MRASTSSPLPPLELLQLARERDKIKKMELMDLYF